MTQAITIKLPENLYLQLKRTAELSRQPVESIIEQSLAHSLPPLLEDIPKEYQPDVYPLLYLDVIGLQQEARSVFPPGKWGEYEALLEKKKESTLTETENARLKILHDEANVLTFRKGYAAVLLKRRGYQASLTENFTILQ